MQPEQEIEFITSVGLLKTKGIGVVNAKKIIECFGSSTKVYEQTKEELTKHIANNPSIIQDILEKKHFAQAEKELEFLTKQKINTSFYYKDDSYPNALKQCPDAPLLFYYKGNIDWNNRKNIAIVGTRKMTAYGKKATQEIVETLSKFDVNIISGLALGVDITAHKKCIELNIPNIAILAHGLDRIYPYQNEKYINRILENGGILSEYGSFDTFRKENFIQRNRIIAGLSSHTIVVESNFKGGAISTAKFAFNYDREVFAVPGRITDKTSEGCNYLIKNLEAQILFQPQDVEKWFGEKQKQTSQQKELFIDLSKKEKQIVTLLKEKGKLQIDLMAYELDQPTYVLMPTLLELEFKEIIQSLPGKFFELN